jgi:hypothetical protein
VNLSRAQSGNRGRWSFDLRQAQSQDWSKNGFESILASRAQDRAPLQQFGLTVGVCRDKPSPEHPPEHPYEPGFLEPTSLRLT